MATMASRAKITGLLSTLTHKTPSFVSGSRSNGARGQIRVNPFGVSGFSFSSSAAPLESNVIGSKDYEDYRRSLYGGITHKALLVDAVGILVVPSQPMAQIYRKIGEKYGVEYSEAEILNRYRWAYEQPWGRSRLSPVLPNVVLEKTGTCIQIFSSAESLIWRAERLFFLNGEQDLSAFLLVGLGIVKYPNYNCIISNQIFSSRNDLLAYEEAIEVAQIMDQSIDENNNESVLRCIELSGSRISNSSSGATQSSTSESLVTCFSCFSALWVYSKVVLLGVSFLECERSKLERLRLRLV